MIRKFDLEVTRYINAISQLRLKVHNDSLTLKNYEIKREQFQQNRIFGTNASQFYQEPNGRDKEENISPDPDETTRFWRNICSVQSIDNHDAK